MACKRPCTHAWGGGGVSPPWPDAPQACACERLPDCLLLLFTLVVVAAAGTHPPPPPPPPPLLFFFVWPGWRWPEKSRNDRKSAGALFWHLNWPDHPEVYIKGRVRPGKKKIRPNRQSAAILDRIFSTSVRAVE